MHITITHAHFLQSFAYNHRNINALIYIHINIRISSSSLRLVILFPFDIPHHLVLYVAQILMVTTNGGVIGTLQEKEMKNYK